MKKILLIILTVTAIGTAWGETITRSLPSSFVPPPPPPNPAAIQNVGSPEFNMFINNMLDPLAQMQNKELSKLKNVIVSNEFDRAFMKVKDPSLSLLPQSYESSVRGLQFVQPSPLHSQ
jgi:hypothetical protein